MPIWDYNDALKSQSEAKKLVPKLKIKISNNNKNNITTTSAAVFFSYFISLKKFF